MIQMRKEGIMPETTSTTDRKQAVLCAFRCGEWIYEDELRPGGPIADNYVWERDGSGIDYIELAHAACVPGNPQRVTIRAEYREEPYEYNGGMDAMPYHPAEVLAEKLNGIIQEVHAVSTPLDDRHDTLIEITWLPAEPTRRTAGWVTSTEANAAKIFGFTNPLDEAAFVHEFGEEVL